MSAAAAEAADPVATPGVEEPERQWVDGGEAPWRRDAEPRPRRTRVVFQEPGGRGRWSGRAATVDQVLTGRPRPAGYRRRTVTVLASALVLLGGSAWAGSMSLQTQRGGVGTGQRAVDAAQWTEQAQLTLTRVSQKLDLIARAEAAWNSQPPQRRSSPPPALTELKAIKSQLELQHKVLQDQISTLESVPEVRSELADLERQAAGLDQTLDALPPEARVPEHAESVDSLARQRALWERRLEAKRAELERLQEGVDSAVSSPLPDVSEAVEQTVESVFALADPDRPRQPDDPAPTTPSSTAPRADDQRRPRDEVGVGAPPNPSGLLGQDPDAGMATGGAVGGAGQAVGGAVEGAGGAVGGAAKGAGGAVAGTARSVLPGGGSGQDGGHTDGQREATGQPANDAVGGQPDRGLRGISAGPTPAVGSLQLGAAGPTARPVPAKTVPAETVPAETVAAETGPVGRRGVQSAVRVADGLGFGDVVRTAVDSGLAQRAAAARSDSAARPQEGPSTEAARARAEAAAASAIMSAMGEAGSGSDSGSGYADVVESAVRSAGESSDHAEYEGSASSSDSSYSSESDDAGDPVDREEIVRRVSDLVSGYTESAGSYSDSLSGWSSEGDSDSDSSDDSGYADYSEHADGDGSEDSDGSDDSGGDGDYSDIDVSDWLG
jgi:hypothetical protein